MRERNETVYQLVLKINEIQPDQWDEVDERDYRLIDAALRRAKAEGVLVWTEEKPHAPGWYWWRYGEMEQPVEVQVWAPTGKFYLKGGISVPANGYDLKGGKWAGPLTAPLDARAAQIEEGE